MCSKKLAKLFLIGFNIVFFLIGAMFLALGIFVLVSKDTLMSVFAKLPKEGQDALQAVDKTSMLDMVCYIIITVGCLLFILGFLGCCGAIREIVCFLMLYAVIVGLILTIQIAAAVVIFIFRDKISTKLRNFVNETLVEDYIGLATDSNGDLVRPTDVISLAWDTAQIKFECCGMVNEEDYQYAKQWVGSYTVKQNGNTLNVNATVPITCCRVTDPDVFPDDLEKLSFTDDVNCLQNPSANNTNTRGCFGAIKDKILKFVHVGMGVGLGTLLIEIIGLVSACYLCRRIKKDREFY